MSFLSQFQGLFSTKEEKEKLEKRDISFFREYDIRGVYPTEINEDFASSLARAFIRERKPSLLAIGYDSRLSSPSLAFFFARECISHGVDVIELGLCTTPFSAWVARTMKHDTVMVTASHNPAHMNGFKLFAGASGEAISKTTGLNEIKNSFKGEHGLTLPKRDVSAGKVLKKDVYKEDYKKALIISAFGSGKKNFPTKNMKLALDYSSGTASLFLNDILYRLGITFDTLHEKPDGTFPGHGPNPNEPKAITALSHLIKNGRFAFGALFDADGDRIVFCDEKGERIHATHVAALFSRHLLAETPSWKNIILTTTVGRSAQKVIEASRGKVYKVPVGRTNVQPAMKKHRAVLGAESSGHYFFKDFDYWDSAIVALLKMLSIVSKESTPISRLIEPFKDTIMLPELIVPYEDGTEGAVIRTLRRHFGGSTETLDGLTVSFRSWWFNIRRSNTEDVWRVTMEGEDVDALMRHKKEIESVVRNVKELTR